ncbi:NAD(P)/FAD-dependent oxidoreductase [Pedococcus sp. NPDC057267]|uniref:NAD(P)/FAD-dependent oxidoreductase n=1 Tax=Pedococcus sp. NPDC057267 TaxID=3346077 RepID=UPI00362D1FF0
MDVGIIGAGPTGLFLGMALVRRGHRVVAVDRDPGPAEDGSWERKGVMQFHHAHGFRPPVTAALTEEVPEAYAAWLALGAEPVTVPAPTGDQVLIGTKSRRATFERALRSVAAREPGLDIRCGHVDGVVAAEGRATGLVVDGLTLPCDLVLDASGRAGRATRDRRERPTTGGSCGVAYVDRQYQLLPGAGPGPLLNPIVWAAEPDGYLVLLFTHEHGIFSVLIIRPTHTRELVGLARDPAFDAAAAAIPGLADWTDPQRSRPITSVLPGGNLMNWYRSQRGPDGRLALPGLLFIGDSVCTTTPIFGRGITTSLMQARALLALLDGGTLDPVELGEEFDAWCEATMRPWVADHVAMDRATQERWSGRDVDLDARLPSDLLLSAVDGPLRHLRDIALPYLAMEQGPASPDPLQDPVRDLLSTGWRPPLDPGPSRAELAAIVAAAA